MYWRVTLALLGVSLAASSFRLPDDVTPLHYDLRLLYDIDPDTNYTYFGVVSILFTVQKPTNKIILHAKDIMINVTEFVADDLIRVDSMTLNKTLDLATIMLSSSLIRGHNYTVTLTFNGNLKEELNGAYISRYDDKSTKSKEYLITTQFQPTHARKAFPCFDEPQYKATFALTIGRHKDYTAVSNMPLSTSSSGNVLENYWKSNFLENLIKKKLSDFVWDEFQTSLPMSTYLLAFVISKFTYVERSAGLSQSKFRVWARKDAINQVFYASKIGPKMLSNYECWFNTSFPLPKLDMFAIPDLAMDAMENWGLITFRESMLLYDKYDSSLLLKEEIAERIGHTLSHQWFGNLVTLKWWSDLWLNEGFATFMSSIGVSSVEPEWHYEQYQTWRNSLSLMTQDALKTSHPLSMSVDPKRISKLFDEISYYKSASLLRMMTILLGENVFRTAITKFLKKYQYKTAEKDDLWQVLTEESLQHVGLMPGVTVKQVMDTWTTQAGYPLLTITRNYTDDTVTVRQKRYLYKGEDSGVTSWWVPLRPLRETKARARAGLQPVEWLADTQGVTNEHRLKQTVHAWEWLLYNPDMSVPCRINYDHHNWGLLSDALASDLFTLIPVLGRVQLVSDAFALAWSGYLDYNTTLQLASYLQHEVDLFPLHTGMGELTLLENLLQHSADYGIFQKFVRSIISQQYERAGGLARKEIVDRTNLTSVKMQTMTSRWACHFRVSGCEKNALQMFKHWMSEVDPDENNQIPLNLRDTVYRVGVSRGGVAQWQFVLERLQNARMESARTTLLTALAQSRDVWILQHYLELTLKEGSVVRRQDAAFTIADVASTPAGFYVAKIFVYTRVKDIYEALKGQESMGLGYILQVLLGQFTTQRQLDEFLSWKDANSQYLEDYAMAVSQAIEGARVNIAWVERNQKVFVDKLKELVE